jgi:hypothetical protein
MFPSLRRELLRAFLGFSYVRTAKVHLMMKNGERRTRYLSDGKDLVLYFSVW